MASILRTIRRAALTTGHLRRDKGVGGDHVGYQAAEASRIQSSNLVSNKVAPSRR